MKKTLFLRVLLQESQASTYVFLQHLSYHFSCHFHFPYQVERLLFYRYFCRRNKPNALLCFVNWFSLLNCYIVWILCVFNVIIKKKTRFFGYLKMIINYVDKAVKLHAIEWCGKITGVSYRYPMSVFDIANGTQHKKNMLR